MTKEEAVERMQAIDAKYLKEDRKDEMHEAADQVLVDLLESLGYGDVTTIYRKLRGDSEDEEEARIYGFWYA